MLRIEQLRRESHADVLNSGWTTCHDVSYPLQSAIRVPARDLVAPRYLETDPVQRVDELDCGPFSDAGLIVGFPARPEWVTHWSHPCRTGEMYRHGSSSTPPTHDRVARLITTGSDLDWTCWRRRGVLCHPSGSQLNPPDDPLCSLGCPLHQRRRP
jgi:hypothetical protein